MEKKKRERKYKCEKHLSNQGYLNKEGEWCCWFCYYENLYLNPNGVVLKELEIKDYVIRIVDRTNSQNKELSVELFTKDEKILDHNYNCRDLSMAIRHFDTLIREILEGLYKKKKKSGWISEESSEEARPRSDSQYITIPSNQTLEIVRRPAYVGATIDEIT